MRQTSTTFFYSSSQACFIGNAELHRHETEVTEFLYRLMCSAAESSRKIVYLIISAISLTSCNNIHHSATDKSYKLDKLTQHYRDVPLKKKALYFLDSNIKDNVSYDDQKRLRYDSTVLNNEEIINNIDLAFASSKGLLYSKTINFNDFLEYVLPYRINTGVIADWRTQVQTDYHRITISKSLDRHTLIDSINSINHHLGKIFSFGKFKGIEDSASYRGLSACKQGSCISMTNLAQYVYRALGLPVATDYVICWGNMNSSHAWNTLKLSDTTLKFMGTEDDIARFDPFSLVEYLDDETLSTYKKPAKVFRKTFSIQNHSLAYKYKDSGLLPPNLRDYRCIDVTNEYLATTSYTYSSQQQQASSPKLLFIANYNDGVWVPVETAENRNNKYSFRGLGTDLLYILVEYRDGLLLPVSAPFYLTKITQTTLKPDFNDTQTLVLATTRSIENDQLNVFETGSDFRNKQSPSYLQLMNLAQGKNRTKPTKNALYSLFYWNKGWQFFGKKKSDGRTITFLNAPKSSLFLLTMSGNDPDYHSRPFCIYKNKVKWL